MNRKKVANNKDSKNLSRLKIFKCFLYGFGTLNLHNEDSHKVYAEFIKECLKNNNFLPQSKSLPEIAYSIKESQHNIPVLYIYYSNRATYQDNAEGVWNIVVEEKILKLQPVCERKFHFIKNKDLKKIGIGKSKQEQLQTLEIDPQENKVEVDNNFLVKEELKQDTAQKNEQLTPSHFQVLDEIEIVLKNVTQKKKRKNIKSNITSIQIVLIVLHLLIKGLKWIFTRILGFQN